MGGTMHHSTFRIMLRVPWLLLLFSSILPASPVETNHRSTPPYRTSIAETTYHYEPVAGKVVGIWPGNWVLDGLYMYKQKYGFTGVLIRADTLQYRNALQAGFLNSSIMAQVWNEDYVYAVDSFPIGMYFIDEPVEHDCSGHSGHPYLNTPQQLAAMRDYIHANRPGAKFITSGYKICSHDIIAATYADVMTFSSYKNWSVFGLPICHVNLGWGNEYENPWLPGSLDQRSSWTAMRNTFGAKNSLAWMAGNGDEYFDLFQHANILGLQSIWLYDHYPPDPLDTVLLESFCYAAWQTGWLNRVSDTPLPIQLASFSASELLNHKVLLEWTTLSEINNYGFEVQRGVNEEQFFTLQNSFVPGQGTTLEPHYYSFVDSLVPATRLHYRLKQIDLDGSIHYTDAVTIDVLASSLNDVHAEFALHQNYPNPFNPSTTISFSVAHSGYAILSIFDVLGRETATLLNDWVNPGQYDIRWNAVDVAGGVYIYRLRIGEFSETRRLVILK